MCAPPLVRRCWNVRSDGKSRDARKAAIGRVPSGTACAALVQCLTETESFLPGPHPRVGAPCSKLSGRRGHIGMWGRGVNCVATFPARRVQSIKIRSSLARPRARRHASNPSRWPSSLVLPSMVMKVVPSSLSTRPVCVQSVAVRRTRKMLPEGTIREFQIVLPALPSSPIRHS